jgi:acyl-CoA thioester hydrolase
LIEPDWDLPCPHKATVVVGQTDIDGYRHANNAVYVQWLDRAAWAHSESLGIPIGLCVALDRGMVVVRTTVVYQRAALLADEIQVATWLIEGSSPLRIGRRFQIVRTADRVTLARACVEYACVQLSTGRPARWPPEFKRAYQPLREMPALTPDLAAL